MPAQVDHFDINPVDALLKNQELHKKSNWDVPIAATIRAWSWPIQQLAEKLRGCLAAD